MGHGLTRLYLADIEAKEGEEYQVEIDNFPMVKQGYFTSDIFIDGRQADYYGECASRYAAKREEWKNSVIFDGFRTMQLNAKTVLRAFTFSKMQTTSESICLFALTIIIHRGIFLR